MSQDLGLLLSLIIFSLVAKDDSEPLGSWLSFAKKIQL
jgi:hypothetical protein